jgi:hypothetical protein
VEGKTTEPRWFAHWWADQRDRNDYVGVYADEVEAEGRIPFYPTPLHEITRSCPEALVDLVEYAWFTWVDETSESLSGWAYIENLLNQLYPDEFERGPHHRVLTTSR